MVLVALNFLELLIVALAAYRAARIVSVDDDEERVWVGAVRERIEIWSANGRRFPRNKIGDLVHCPFCSGVWLSWTAYAVAVFALGRYGTVGVWAHLIEAWAVAGGQALFTALDNGLTDNRVELEMEES